MSLIFYIKWTHRCSGNQKWTHRCSGNQKWTRRVYSEMDKSCEPEMDTSRVLRNGHIERTRNGLSSTITYHLKRSLHTGGTRKSRFASLEMGRLVVTKKRNRIIHADLCCQKLPARFNAFEILGWRKYQSFAFAASVCAVVTTV